MITTVLQGPHRHCCLRSERGLLCKYVGHSRTGTMNQRYKTNYGLTCPCVWAFWRAATSKKPDESTLQNKLWSDLSLSMGILAGSHI